jgi:hypothetical protein
MGDVEPELVELLVHEDHIPEDRSYTSMLKFLESWGIITPLDRVFQIICVTNSRGSYEVRFEVDADYYGT